MTRLLLLFAFIFCILTSYNNAWCCNQIVGDSFIESDSVYVKCDKYPEFYGGKDSLIQFLSRNLQYPEEALQKGITGKVYVKFIVDRFGKLKNPSVVRKTFVRVDTMGQRSSLNSSDSICLKLTEEALRVVQIMPQWNPGMVKGDIVNAWFMLPFSFELPSKVPEKLEPYVIVEEMPEFPGGQDALLSYLMRSIIYPVEAQRKREQGTVYLRFIIGVDGSVQSVQMFRSSGSILLDNEAIRVVSKMPKWTPGKKSGKNVPVSYTLPVRFSL